MQKPLCCSFYLFSFWKNRVVWPFIWNSWDLLLLLVSSMDSYPSSQAFRRRQSWNECEKWEMKEEGDGRIGKSPLPLSLLPFFLSLPPSRNNSMANACCACSIMDPVLTVLCILKFFRTLDVEQRESLINSVPDEENDLCSNKNEHLS